MPSIVKRSNKNIATDGWQPFVPTATNLPDELHKLLIRSPMSQEVVAETLVKDGGLLSSIDALGAGQFDLVATGTGGVGSLYYALSASLDSPPLIFERAVGSTGTPPPTTVSGIIQVNGQAAPNREVRAFSYDSTPHNSRGEIATAAITLGSATSEPDGSYSITLLQGYTDPVFVVAFDDIGEPFTPSATLEVGDRIRPSVFEGYVFECDGAGELPATEPTWLNDPAQSALYGTASLRAKPFFRPQAHGPIVPAVS